jgi:hypothetical protein
LVDGDFILLQGETTLPATYLDRVFEVGGVGAAITLTLREDGQAGDGVPVAGDYIHVTSGTDYSDTLWHYDGTEWTIALGVPPYTTFFNATTDWGVAAGGYYTITITEAVHNQGTATIDVSFFESSGGDWVEIQVDNVSIDQTTGDVSFSVPESPDNRFAGRVTLDAGLGGTSISIGGSGTNLFTGDQTQTADRTHDQGNFNQNINNAGEWALTGGGNSLSLNVGAGQISQGDGVNGNSLTAVDVTFTNGVDTAFFGLTGAQIVDTEAFYFGDATTDGTWRIIRSGTDLVFQRREAGVYVTKSTMTA